jgi:6-phosphogluconolactonase (cycloisomerase 2 family)
MKNTVKPRLLWWMVAVCLSLPHTLLAQQYIVTNDNVFNATNSTTVLQVNNAGKVKVLKTYTTGGASSGGSYFAVTGVTWAHTSSNYCVFVSNGGASTIAAFTLAPSTGVLTTVAGSPFSYGVSGAQQFSIGLAQAGNKYLFAGNTAFNSISELQISPTCGLTLVKTYSVPGPPDGMKVTPNGKFLIAAYLGQVDSFSINPTTGALTELGPLTSQGTAAGVEISCDSSTAYFGDAATNIQVEVFSISSSGKLAELNNFNDSSGVNSNNVLLSPDGSTLYVSNTMSNQITALTTGPGGALTFGSITAVNGTPVFVLNLAMGKSGKDLFVMEQNSVEGIGSLAANGTSLTEVLGSPFSGINNGDDPPSFTTIPGKVCH